MFFLQSFSNEQATICRCHFSHFLLFSTFFCSHCLCILWC